MASRKPLLYPLSYEGRIAPSLGVPRPSSAQTGQLRRDTRSTGAEVFAIAQSSGPTDDGPSIRPEDSLRLIRRLGWYPMIRQLEPGDAASCDAIVAGLPEWFGDETGIRDCAEAVRAQSSLVADDAGEVVGFCTYELRPPGSAEITWMAVRADRHRTGIGTAIIDALVGRLATQGTRLLLVKTLSDRNGPYLAYDQTRRFYLKMGFLRVAELDIWGPDDPALLLAKPLQA